MLKTVSRLLIMNFPRVLDQTMRGVKNDREVPMRYRLIFRGSVLPLFLAILISDPVRCSVPQTVTLAAQFPPAIVITEGKVAQGFPYLTGGVGSDERAAMEERAKNYNVKLVFAAKDGSFLADVKLTITGGKDFGAINATATGPWFYIQLPPGIYHVKADFEGRSKEAKLVGVVPDRRVQQVFVWDLEAGKKASN